MVLVVESQCGLTGLHVLCRPPDPISPIALSDSLMTAEVPTLPNFLPATNSLEDQETVLLIQEMLARALT